MFLAKKPQRSISSVLASLFIFFHGSSLVAGERPSLQDVTSTQIVVESVVRIIVSVPASVISGVQDLSRSVEKAVTLEEFLGQETTVAIKEIQPIAENTQRWVLERGSDQQVAAFDIKAKQMPPAEKQPVNISITVSNETYGIMLHHNNEVVAFFMNQAGIEKFGTHAG